MERFQSGNLELEYRTWGLGDPVIFVHGVLLHDAFLPLLAESELQDRFQLVHYHRRGYGGSSRVTTPVGIREHAQDLAQLIQHLGVDRVHVVGHSYGGAIALQLALDWPETTRSLVLIEPAIAVGEAGRLYREALARATERFLRDDAEVVVDAFIETRWPGYRVSLERELPGAFDQAVLNARTTFAYELPALAQWQFGSEEARQIRTPCLSVLGDVSAALDRRFGDTHRLLLQELPRAKGTVIAGCAHFAPIETPKELAKAITEFLESNSWSHT